jgi:hypothetical protein
VTLPTDLDSLRRQAILASLAGFPFLVAAALFAGAWTARAHARATWEPRA